MTTQRPNKDFWIRPVVPQVFDALGGEGKRKHALILLLTDKQYFPLKPNQFRDACIFLTSVSCST